MVNPKVSAKPTASPNSSGETATVLLLQEINNYRTTQGLSPVKTDPKTCAFAQTRAQEITTQFDHAGFKNRIENKSLPYTSYSEITENIAMNSNYKEVVSMWINSSGHAENMRKDTPFVCAKQNGNYFAYEGWRP